MFGEDKETGRGFKFVAFTDAYGAECSLQQSSAIGERDLDLDNPGYSFVWLGIDDAKPRIMKSRAQELGIKLPPGEVSGWMDYPLPPDVQIATRMHLNREQVQGLIERLQTWLDTGEFNADADSIIDSESEPAAEAQQPVRVNQIELVSNIMMHLDKQGIKTLRPDQINEIITAANLIVAACEKPFVPAEPNSGLDKWLKSDDTGLSSLTIAYTLSPNTEHLAFIRENLRGMASHHQLARNFPRDSSDLGRCIRMLDAEPTLRERLQELHSLGPIWGRFAYHWCELESLYRAGQLDACDRLMTSLYAPTSRKRETSDETRKGTP